LSSLEEEEEDERISICNNIVDVSCCLSSTRCEERKFYTTANIILGVVSGVGEDTSHDESTISNGNDSPCIKFDQFYSML